VVEENQMNPFNTPSPRAQQGSMLLEVLIALMIFAMGILGVIGLQATAINNTLDARYRSDAALIANQIIGVMWADPDITTTPRTVKASYACAPCTSSSTNNNLNDWVGQIRGAGGQPVLLPAGSSGTANQPSIAINGNQVIVTINWQSPQNGALSHNYVTKTEIQFN